MLEHSGKPSGERSLPSELMLKGKGDQFLNENRLIFIWYKLTLYLPELSHPKMCIGAVYIHFTKVRTEDRTLIKRKLYSMRECVSCSAVPDSL